MSGPNPTDGQTQTNLDPATGLPATLVYVGYDGYQIALSQAVFGVGYRTTYHTTSTDVYLLLYWPPQATLANVAGHYEVATRVNLS